MQQQNDLTFGKVMKIVAMVIGSLFLLGCILFCLVAFITVVIGGGSFAALVAWIGLTMPQP